MRTGLLFTAMGLLAAGCGPPGFERLGSYELEMFTPDSMGQFSLATFKYDAASHCEALDQSFSATMNGASANVTRCEGPPGGCTYVELSPKLLVIFEVVFEVVQ